MTLHETLDPYVAAPAKAATFHDLMASIGYLLFQWNLLESSLDEEIALLRHAGGDTAARRGRSRTINERLAEWRALLSRGRRRQPDHHAAVDRIGERIQDFQRLHALVATGFVAASVEGEPAIRCAHPSFSHSVGEDVRLTARDMVDMVEAMELCRSEMALLRGLSEQ